MKRLNDYLQMGDVELGELHYSDVDDFAKSNSANDVYELVLRLNNYRFVNCIRSIRLQIKCFKQILINDEWGCDYCIESLLSNQNDYVKMKWIDSINDNSYKKKLLSTIKSDNLLLKYYERCDNELKVSICCFLNNDENKLKLMHSFISVSDQVMIIKSFHSMELIKKYAILPEYSNYRSNLMCIITDHDFVVNYFKNSKSIDLKLNMINKVTDKKLKSRLISELDDKLCRDILQSNENNFKDSVLKSIDIDDIVMDVDKDITIGVELEACNRENRKVLGFTNFFSNWEITCDRSVKNGVEIVSPILRFDKKSLSELYYVCSFMNNDGFYIDKTCGGHIHLGFNYFKTINEFMTFLKLYGSVEEVLYIISNRAGIKTRTGAKKYAVRTKEVLGQISNLYVDYEKIDDLSEFAVLVRNAQATRYYGLNLKNIDTLYKNTIEFRIPNGEINFREIVNNIRLFAKMMEKAKLIASRKKIELERQYNYLLKNNLDNKERLNILLDMLFEHESDKVIYIKRYDKNKPFGLYKNKNREL